MKWKNRLAINQNVKKNFWDLPEELKIGNDQNQDEDAVWTDFSVIFVEKQIQLSSDYRLEDLIMLINWFWRLTHDSREESVSQSLTYCLTNWLTDWVTEWLTSVAEETIFWQKKISINQSIV